MGGTYSKEFWENQDGNDPAVFWIGRVTALQRNLLLMVNWQIGELVNW